MRRVDSLEKTDAGRDWGQEEKGMTEDEIAGWHHWLDGHESEWTLGVGDGQGGLACCDSWGLKESDTTEWLIWSECSTVCNPLNSFVHGILQARILECVAVPYYRGSYWPRGQPRGPSVLQIDSILSEPPKAHGKEILYYKDFLFFLLLPGDKFFLNVVESWR